MLDQILSFVKDQMGSDVANQHGLDDQQQQEVFATAQNAMQDTIKQQSLQGGLGGIMDIFNGGGDQNGFSGEMIQKVVGSLKDKFGFDDQKAGGIANQIIPAIMSRFSSPETGQASDGADLLKKVGLDGDNDLGDLIGKFTGGNTDDLLNSVKGFFGK